VPSPPPRRASSARESPEEALARLKASANVDGAGLLATATSLSRVASVGRRRIDEAAAKRAWALGLRKLKEEADAVEHALHSDTVALGLGAGAGAALADTAEIDAAALAALSAEVTAAADAVRAAVRAAAPCAAGPTGRVARGVPPRGRATMTRTRAAVPAAHFDADAGALADAARRALEVARRSADTQGAELARLVAGAAEEAAAAAEAAFALPRDGTGTGAANASAAVLAAAARSLPLDPIQAYRDLDALATHGPSACLVLRALAERGEGGLSVTEVTARCRAFADRAIALRREGVDGGDEDAYASVSLHANDPGAATGLLPAAGGGPAGLSSTEHARFLSARAAIGPVEGSSAIALARAVSPLLADLSLTVQAIELHEHWRASGTD